MDVFTELIRYTTVFLLLYSAWIIFKCPCATPTKPLLECSNHKWQFGFASALALLFPLMEEAYKKKMDGY
jgi:hypothetical protein